MKSRANDHGTPHDDPVKTVCLDCGCEFQSAGSGRDQRECPICSEGSGSAEDPDKAEWDRVLQPRARTERIEQKSPIEVEVTRARPPEPDPRPRPDLPGGLESPASPDADPAARHAAPVAGNAARPAPRTEESTEDLLDELRDLGFQMTDDGDSGR